MTDYENKSNEELISILLKRDKRIEYLRKNNAAHVKNNKVLNYHNRINTAALSANTEKYRVKYNKKLSGVKADLKAFKENYIKQIEGVYGTFDWDKDKDRAKTVEIMLRAIVTYKQLTDEKTITYGELAYLCVGTQMEFFTLQDVSDRFHVGTTDWSNLGIVKRAGWIKKIHQKKGQQYLKSINSKYHITVSGRDRLNDILRYIYENKIGTYKILKKVLGEEDDTENGI